VGLNDYYTFQDPAYHLSDSDRLRSVASLNRESPLIDRSRAGYDIRNAEKALMYAYGNRALIDEPSKDVHGLPPANVGTRLSNTKTIGDAVAFVGMSTYGETGSQLDKNCMNYRQFDLRLQFCNGLTTLDAQAAVLSGGRPGTHVNVDALSDAPHQVSGANANRPAPQANASGSAPQASTPARVSGH
jgi:hypothetical protein